jgi:hypothetical protein
MAKKELPPISSFPMTIKDAIYIEHSIGSKNISYEYTVQIDTTLYPNILSYKLTKVKSFLRPSPDSIMNYTIEYFATSDDSVRTILHEWNLEDKQNSTINDPTYIDSDLQQVQIINAFQAKFANLDSTFTSLFGKPVVKDIKSNFFGETERDDVKWIGQNHLNVYLLMFKRNNNIYRNIRVIAYPK